MRQSGAFVPMDDLYLAKLEEKAELIVHNFTDGCAGFVFFYCNDPEKVSSYITLVMVAPKARKSGVATNLVNCVLNLSKRRGFEFCCLEVRKENRAALSLYESIGFSVSEDRGEKYLMKIRIA